MADDITIDRIREDQIIEVFVDRDPKVFEQLISFLRNDQRAYPEFSSIKEEIEFNHECKYWKIPNPMFEENRLLDSIPKGVKDLLNEEPQKLKYEPLARWRQLGPLNIMDVFNNN